VMLYKSRQNEGIAQASLKEPAVEKADSGSPVQRPKVGVQTAWI